MNKVLQLSEVLTTKHDWCQGENIKWNSIGGTACCLVEAIFYTGQDKTLPRKICNLLNIRVELQSIFDWNDAPERTFADVQALIRAVET